MEEMVIGKVPDEVRLLNGKAWITKEVSLTDLQKIVKYLPGIKEEYCYTERALGFFYKGIETEKLSLIEEGKKDTIEYDTGIMVVRRVSFRLFVVESKKEKE